MGGVDSHLDEFLALSEQLAGQNGDGGGSVAHLLVLGLGDVDEDLGGWIVDVHRAQDCGAVIGHVDLACFGACPHRNEDLVHSPGAQCGLDQIRDGDCAYERRLI